MGPAGCTLRRRLSLHPGTTEVWEADGPEGRRVAVKLLTDTGRVREDLALRFAAEGRLLSELGGRHGLIGCHAVSPDPPAIVLELAEGGDLRSRLERGPLALRIVVVLGRQVASALTWLHEAGVIHRDVKPSNILMAGDGSFRLADLGVAAHGTPPRGLPEGWIEEEIGTAGYAAPELLADAAAADPRLDSYGLGAVLFEAITGELPFPMREGEDDAAYRQRRAEPAPAPEVVDAAARVGAPAVGDPRLPLLSKVLRRALDPDPAARWQSAAELARALAPLA